MKVALLFFGQPRFLENKKTFQTHCDKIINKYDTDVFCHTWWSLDQNTYETSSWSRINNCAADKHSINKIVEMYKPKVTRFQESINFNISEESNYNKITKEYEFAFNNRNNIMSHLYSLTKVGELLEDFINTTGTKYDFVVVSRLDADVIRFPNLNELDPNNFYLPNHHERFPDNLFVFGPEYINFCKIFPNIEELSTKVWEPSPEAFKWMNYNLYFKKPPVPHQDVYAEFVRSN